MSIESNLKRIVDALELLATAVAALLIAKTHEPNTNTAEPIPTIDEARKALFELADRDRAIEIAHKYGTEMLRGLEYVYVR